MPTEQAPGPLIVEIGGTALAASDRERLRHPMVGGVILFERQFESLAQLSALCRAIHRVRRPPLIVCVDHEGGRVQRFRSGFSRLPPMRELGRAWDRDPMNACRLATGVGRTIGAELRAVGVDLSFTPVLDLDDRRSEVIGDRAIHADPRAVTMLARCLVQGLHQAGMANCAKHFPGHGHVRADSHLAIPIDRRARRTLLARDAAPYGWLADVLSAVMPAHVVYPRVDRLPAGFSRLWLGEVLRGTLGFDGAVISDDLQMAGAAGPGDLATRANCALDAGCDLLIVCGGPGGADPLLECLRWRGGPKFAGRVAKLRGR